MSAAGDNADTDGLDGLLKSAQQGSLEDISRVIPMLQRRGQVLDDLHDAFMEDGKTKEARALRTAQFDNIIKLISVAPDIGLDAANSNPRFLEFNGGRPLAPSDLTIDPGRSITFANLGPNGDGAAVYDVQTNSVRKADIASDDTEGQDTSDAGGEGEEDRTTEPETGDEAGITGNRKDGMEAGEVFPPKARTDESSGRPPEPAQTARAQQPGGRQKQPYSTVLGEPYKVYADRWAQGLPIYGAQLGLEGGYTQSGAQGAKNTERARPMVWEGDYTPLPSGEPHRQPFVVNKTPFIIPDSLPPVWWSEIQRRFPEDQWSNAAKILLAESTGRPDEINTKAGTYRGLYQISSVHIPVLVEKGIIRDSNDLFDPRKNIEAAAYVYKNSEGGWNQWGTWKKIRK